jgi:hypothetical protein
VLLAAALLGGCGGDEEPAETPAPAPTAEATPTATAEATPTPTPTPSPAETPAGTATPAPESPEDQPGGAGDEEAIRVPVRFTVDGEGITPPQVAVPAFLALELIVANDLPEPVTVRLEGAEPLTVGPGQTGRVRLEGRRPGTYAVDAGAAGTAELVTGVEPGP